MAMKGSNETSWHLQGTDEDPLTSTEVTCFVHLLMTPYAPVTCYY